MISNGFSRRSGGAFLAALGLCLAGCAAHGLPPTSPSPLVGQPIPAFKRNTIDGGSIDTGSLRGKTVVLKLFAKYCEPCKRTLPAVENFHKSHPDVAFIGISEDESESDARQMVERFGLTFPVVLDRDNILAGRLRTSEMPATFVVDKQGVVRWFGDSKQPEDNLTRAIEEIDRGAK